MHGESPRETSAARNTEHVENLRSDSQTGRHRAPSDDVLSVRRAIAGASAQLSESGIASARVDAELLASFVLQTERSHLGLADGFTDEQAERFAELVAERAGRVPLQHLTGEAAFRYLSLAVGPGVFIPRPETELLVDWGLKQLHASASQIVVDFCAGSGAIALSLAHEARVRVHAVEQDPLAVAWLRRNAETRAEAGDPPISVHSDDATSSEVLSKLNSCVDLVLSNPPYIPLGSSIAEEVHHDPELALWGGEDGLDIVRGLVGTAARLLKPGGWFGFEHGEQHAPSTNALLPTSQWGQIEHVNDLTGRPRFTIAQRLAHA